MPDDGIDRDSLMEVCLVFNGALEMSPGKMAGQAFQVAFRAPVLEEQREYRQIRQSWINQGTRTIVRVVHRLFLSASVQKCLASSCAMRVLRRLRRARPPCSSLIPIAMPIDHRCSTIRRCRCCESLDNS
jgi:hypothetical protein